jgi:serine/threonine protein phosphatase PrpC
MASDGLWDELDKDEVKKLVEQNDGNKENIISSLYQYAF